MPDGLLNPITPNEARPVWPGPGAHSAVKLWGRDWAWVSDEVYGTATAPGHGCPWGWTRMVDISDPKAPTVEAEYREPENDPETCDTWNPPRTSYSAHNPTLTPHIGFSTWHSGGMQAVSVARPEAPYQLAEFLPKPLKHVDLEDPRLSSDPDTGRNEKVVMWSYAIVKDGLHLRRRPPQRPVRPRVPRTVRPRGAQGALPRRQLQPGRRALLRAGGAGAAALSLTE